MHEQGIIHRDLKLENIMVCKNGYIKLIDFGLARRISESDVATTKAGTDEYMAPEMLASNHRRRYDKRIDWWAVGILLFEMLTGRTPFYHPKEAKVLNNIKYATIRWPPTDSGIEYSSDFKDLVDSLL